MIINGKYSLPSLLDVYRKYRALRRRRREAWRKGFAWYPVRLQLAASEIEDKFHWLEHVERARYTHSLKSETWVYRHLGRENGIKQYSKFQRRKE